VLIDGERDSDRPCVGLSRSRRADRRAARLDQHWQDVIVHTGHDKRAPPSRRDVLVRAIFHGGTIHFDSLLYDEDPNLSATLDFLA
jgi:hypothetical protein